MALLKRVMREFEQLVLEFESGLQRSLDDNDDGDMDNDDGDMDNDNDNDNDNADARTAAPQQHATRRGWCREDVRREACRMAISDLSNKYARQHIHRSLHAAESEGKRVEEQLHRLALSASHATITTTTTTTTTTTSTTTTTAAANDDDDDDELDIHHGYFRLYSTELFDLLGQPTDLRLGTLRFHKHQTWPARGANVHSPAVAVELALNNSFFVADSDETLPYHAFRMPTTPSLQNRGILSRDPDDDGAFPAFDSWLLFTFLGNGCIKLEVPIEMCAHVYGGRLRGRENEEVTFWGFFVDDDTDS